MRDGNDEGTTTTGRETTGTTTVGRGITMTTTTTWHPSPPLRATARRVHSEGRRETTSPGDVDDISWAVGKFFSFLSRFIFFVSNYFTMRTMRGRPDPQHPQPLPWVTARGVEQGATTTTATRWPPPHPNPLPRVCAGGWVFFVLKLNFIHPPLHLALGWVSFFITTLVLLPAPLTFCVGVVFFICI